MGGGNTESGPCGGIVKQEGETVLDVHIFLAQSVLVWDTFCPLLPVLNFP